ncbi:unnamed protein product [Adineta ricciae]|uniref:Tudor domain-containing protein n=1 Tax=Adineta ricciae TaxID=249248 RepID=A0A815ZEP0_ADIRI|nr:unnamed protein product [Adineta ricciae]
MDPARRSTRHLESRSSPTTTSPNDALRRSTNDSGRGSMLSTDRTPVNESIASNGASPSSLRVTPLDDSHNSVNDANQQSNKSVRIRPMPVLEGKCYEQAYVSHIDHPSAFFLQLAHSRVEFEKLQEEINKFYTNNPTNDLVEWKPGDYCVAKFTDNMYYRARIVNVSQSGKKLYDVVYLDYGNWHPVAKSDIHPLLPRFASLPAQGIACSLTKSLPKHGSDWEASPAAVEHFKELVSDKFVNATIRRKTTRDLWPLKFVDLELCSSKINVREEMKNYIREASNDQIFIEFGRHLKREDYFIYSIPFVDDNVSDGDDETE